MDQALYVDIVLVVKLAVHSIVNGYCICHHVTRT